MRKSRSAVAAVAGSLAIILATVVAAALPAGVAAAASPPSQGWTTVTAPLPNDAGTNPYVYIASSTCPAANGCFSVGSYADTSDKYWGLIEAQSGTSWTQKEAPEPSGAGSGSDQYAELGSEFCLIALTGCSAISCPTATWCVTVGGYESSAANFYGMLDTLDNGIWTSVQAQEPSDRGTGSDQFADLQSVSCTSTTSCVAVGRYENTSGDQEPLIEVLSGSTWTPVTGRVPSGGNDGALTDVSCTTSFACAAVGTYNDADGKQNGLIEMYTGSSWNAVSAPVPSTSGTDGDGDLLVFPYAMTCASPTSCAMVGTYENTSGREVGLIDTLSGTTWAATEAQEPGDEATGSSQSAELQKVSCPAPTYCVTVGSYRTTSGGQAGLIDTLFDGVWTATAAPQGAHASTAAAEDAELMDVDCGASEQCMASGLDTTTANGEVALVDVLVNGQWSVTSAAEPSDTQTTTAASGIARTVACDAPDACVVAGTYSDSGGYTQGLLDTFTGVQGYWLGASDGGIFAFGNAQYYGSTGNITLNKPIVGMAGTPDGQGYWFVGSDGGIFTEGDAAYQGSTGSITLNKPIVGMAATPDGQGYWLVASDGGIFTEGDAAYEGSTGNIKLNKPIVGMAATPDGLGYWMVASDGGIFTEGDAQFQGSMGGTVLNKPIVGMAATPDGLGYWLVASDGGIFAFGDAPFYGSTGALTLNKPIVGMAPTPDGKGYWLVASDGGIFAFGDAPFYGSTGALTLNKPIVGMAT